MARFVAAVTQRTPLYPLADELGACSVNVFRPGWSHAWHFDESEFTTTLCLQSAEAGGTFEFTEPLRSTDADLAAGPTAAVVNSHSQYDVLPTEPEAPPPPIRTAPFEPGTLQIFAGRYSLHRVTDVGGDRTRLVAVMCFANEPGFVNSPSVQQMFWGRVAQPD